jgi:hypothetical protein
MLHLLIYGREYLFIVSQVKLLDKIIFYVVFTVKMFGTTSIELASSMY